MKKYSFMIVSVILILMFGKLTMNYKDRYKLEEGSVILSECTKDSAAVVKAIVAKNYLPSEEDAAFAVGHMKKTFKSGAVLSSLYDLNKRDWRIPAEQIEKNGSKYYLDLLESERKAMGVDNDFNKLNTASLNSSIVIDNNHAGSITVNVNKVNSNAGIIDKVFKRDRKPCKGVVVRLYKHFIDKDQKVNSHPIAHAITDASGKATFKGLDKALSYSVIPIKKGYDYGSSQGTDEGSLAKSTKKGSLVCNFVENPHKVKVFNTTELKNLKSDHYVIVRSLKTYLSTMMKYMAVFFLIWWAFIFLYKRRNPGADSSIISIIMMLTGVCLLMMFSMNDPLNDKMIGIDMAQGVIAGVVVMMLLQFVNFRAFYQGKSRLPFDIPAAIIKYICWPFGLYKKADALFNRLPKGFGYMLVAVILTMLLFTPLGVAVGGMKVNLNIGILFQPSEIAKYLIVIFIAAFFCANADKIVKFSDKGNVDLFGSKMKMLGGILLGLIFLMGLYLLLGDMGPAMVLSFTFIIMYSIIKSKVDLEGLSEKDQLKHILSCDLAMLVYGVLSFVIMLYVGSLLGLMWVFCLSWFALWIIFGLFKKRIFESAIVFNLIIAAFVFGASIMNAIPGLGSVGERLESRNEMCTNTWGTLPLDGATADAGENTQVAEGLWGLASGGFFGQGIGKGYPSLIPAFHTDMILSSIGEQLGFIGILAIVILLILLLRKTVLQGYKAAHPFTFYLCLGIAVVTGVQFIIITLGSTGIIPLTGVTVPFFSFGKVSMILNLAAFGIVLSIAGRAAREREVSAEVAELRKNQMKKYDYSIALTSLAFFVVSVFILGVYLKYQVFQRDEILIRPVYVNNNEGYPVVKYNPRFDLISDKMPVGNIYDRNGVLLATSDINLLNTNFSNLLTNGVDTTYLTEHMKLRLRRYYPYGNHLFFMLGDYNTQFLFKSSGTRGYFAEHEHLSYLRGYDNRLIKDGKEVKVELKSDSFKPGKFHEADSCIVTSGIQLRDYSALLPALKSGKQIGTTPQDIHLTIDAKLQTELQNRLKAFVANDKNIVKGKGKNKPYMAFQGLRISVVVLDAKQGDLLASAVYPLPDQRELMKLSDSELDVYNDNHKPSEWKAYADMDLGLYYDTEPGSTAKVLTSIAALKQEEITVADSTIYIYPAELIRTPGHDGNMNMGDGLKYSSNPFFIHLMNSRDLYDTACELYEDLNIRIPGKETARMETAVDEYNRYMSKRSSEPMKLNNGKFPRCWAWAWGQGDLRATPLGMARAISIPANGGHLPNVRYIRDSKSGEQASQNWKEVLDVQKADKLRSLLAEVSKSVGTNGAKTGTPQREWTDSRGKKHNQYDDGWFICFLDDVSVGGKEDEKSTISIAVRLERGPASAQAQEVTKKVVLEALKDLNYIKK